MGGAPEQMGALPAADEDAIEVWGSNWDAVSAFLAVETQWQILAGFSGAVWLGINYAGADVVFRRRNITDEQFEDIREMERAALDVFSKEAN